MAVTAFEEVARLYAPEDVLCRLHPHVRRFAPLVAAAFYFLPPCLAQLLHLGQRNADRVPQVGDTLIRVLYILLFSIFFLFTLFFSIIVYYTMGVIAVITIII